MHQVTHRMDVSGKALTIDVYPPGHDKSFRDEQWMALCNEHPGLSFFADSEEEAFNGLVDLVEFCVQEDWLEEDNA